MIWGAATPATVVACRSRSASVRWPGEKDRSDVRVDQDRPRPTPPANEATFAHVGNLPHRYVTA